MNTLFTMFYNQKKWLNWKLENNNTLEQFFQNSKFFIHNVKNDVKLSTSIITISSEEI